MNGVGMFVYNLHKTSKFPIMQDLLWVHNKNYQSELPVSYVLLCNIINPYLRYILDKDSMSNIFTLFILDSYSLLVTNIWLVWV